MLALFCIKLLLRLAEQPHIFCLFFLCNLLSILSALTALPPNFTGQIVLILWLQCKFPLLLEDSASWFPSWKYSLW